MGAVHFSLDRAIVQFFKKHLPLINLVETGTFWGDTLASFAGDFENLFSVEFSKELYEVALKRFDKTGNIHLSHGDSPSFIHDNKYRWEDTSTLYWLDAHWCEASDTAGAEAQCPLLQEIQSIGDLPKDSVIIIDDARLFVCSPSGDHNLDQWPDLDSIINELRNLSSKHRLSIINDTIVFYPQNIFGEFRAFCQKHGRDVLTAWDKSRDYDTLLVQLKEKEAVIQEKERALLALHDEHNKYVNNKYIKFFKRLGLIK